MFFQRKHYAIVLSICIAACTAGAKKKPVDCSERFQSARGNYEKQRYSKAQEILSNIKFNCSGHQATDSIIYYLARSLYELDRPLEAQTEFQHLRRDYPRSPFYDKAGLYIGLSSFNASLAYNRDQSETRDAIRHLQDFINSDPPQPLRDSAKVYLHKCRKKLAKKEYKTAELYEKLNKYEAAVIYYRSVIDKFPESEYAPQAKLHAAQNLIRLHRTREARRLIASLLNDDTADDAIVKKARQLKQQLPSTDS